MDFSNLSKRKILLYGGGVLAIFCFLVLALQAGPMSREVAANADSARLMAGQHWAEIDISGRDVSITGAAPSALAEAAVMQAVADQWGVRSVQSEFSILDASLPAPSLSRLVASGPALTDSIACQSLFDGLLANGSIEFETGRTALQHASLTLLDGLGAALLRCQGFHVQIEGHTDATGDAGANQTLSEGRAKVVRAYLIERGVPNSGIAAIGIGAVQPIADNATAEGRARNRRIEFRVSR